METIRAFLVGILSLTCLLSHFSEFDGDSGLFLQIIGYVGSSNITYSVLVLLLYDPVKEHLHRLVIGGEVVSCPRRKFILQEKHQWITNSHKEAMMMHSSKGMKSPMFIVETLNQVYHQPGKTSRREKKEDSQFKILAMSISKLIADLKSKSDYVGSKKACSLTSPCYVQLLKNLELILNNFAEQRCSTKASSEDLSSMSKDDIEALMLKYYNMLIKGIEDIQPEKTRQKVRKDYSFSSLVETYNQQNTEEADVMKIQLKTSDQQRSRKHSIQGRQRSQFNRIKERNSCKRKTSLFSKASNLGMASPEESVSDDSGEEMIKCIPIQDYPDNISKPRNMRKGTSINTCNFNAHDTKLSKIESQRDENLTSRSDKNKMATLDKSRLAPRLKNLTELSLCNSSSSEEELEILQLNSEKSEIEHSKGCGKHPQIKRIEDQFLGNRSQRKQKSEKRAEYSQFSPRYFSKSQINSSKNDNILNSDREESEEEEDDQNFNQNQPDEANLGVRLKDSDRESYEECKNIVGDLKKLSAEESNSPKLKIVNFDQVCDKNSLIAQPSNPNSSPPLNTPMPEPPPHIPTTPQDFLEFSSQEEESGPSSLSHKISLSKTTAPPSKFQIPL
ncbi:unnamed protein product [Moneuplotes crassus]|uniref:Uncharacterized protein n=1 Tax=Euplotes crassus TaxID=5936 RepID=A0AAD1Y5Z1_EUPCR|nr:unnamed protein product [Moneuplotes crassus]